MAASSNYALRVPFSLMEDVRLAADTDGVSMNAFMVQAIAEKLAALRASGRFMANRSDDQVAYLNQRAAQTSPERMIELLAVAGTTSEVLPGDEMPEGWLDAVEPGQKEQSRPPEPAQPRSGG